MVKAGAQATTSWCSFDTTRRAVIDVFRAVAPAEAWFARAVADGRIRWRYWDAQGRGPFPGTPEIYRYWQAWSRPSPHRGKSYSKHVYGDDAPRTTRTTPRRRGPFISRVEFAGETIVAALPATRAMFEIAADDESTPVLPIEVRDNRQSVPPKRNWQGKSAQAYLKAAMEVIAKVYPSKEAMEATPRPPTPPFKEIFARLKGEIPTPGLERVFPDLPRAVALEAFVYAPWLKGRSGIKSSKSTK